MPDAHHLSPGGAVPDRILITGASGGLGRALAMHYAGPGRRLILWGRDPDRLAATARMCRAAGADATIRSVDQADIPAALAHLADEQAAGPIGLALLVAGLGNIRAADDLVEDATQVARTGLVNFVATAALAAALARTMATRGAGRIVLVGSAAAFHALPFAPAYAGSKAGLARFAEALRIEVRRHGVGVTLVSPGFIDTALDRTVPDKRPFVISAAQAAARIAAAVDRGSAHAIFPWPFVVLRWVDRLLPRPLRDRLLGSLTPPG